MNSKDYEERRAKYELEISALKKDLDYLLDKGRRMTQEEFDRSVELTDKIVKITRERNRFEETTDIDGGEESSRVLPNLSETGPILIHGVRNQMNP